MLQNFHGWLKSFLFLGMIAWMIGGWGYGKEVFQIDFQQPDVQKAIQASPYAKVVDGTLFVEVPKEKGMVTAMVRIPIGHWMQEFQDHFVLAEAEVCFRKIPQPAKPYFGAKYQFYLPGSQGNCWPSLLNLPSGQKPWGTLHWHSCRSQAEWRKTATDAVLELGIQGANGFFAIRNIRFSKGAPCPASTLAQEVIPQARYSVQQPPRVRGVMSPNTVLDPQENDFAEIEKWGANLIRWQMGFPKDLKDLAQTREILWNRFAQIEKVLEMAKRHRLLVVLDVHTMRSSRPILLGTPEGRDLLVEFWCETARRFKDHPNLFGYNLMNEPVSADIEPDGPTLNEQYRRLIHSIREIDSRTSIILDCDGAGVPEKLEYLEVFPYENIIYSPHFYKPFELTHQLDEKQGKYLGYPNPEQGWDKAFLRKELERVREFQLRTGARIYIGEFSCIRWAPGAELFLKDCIDLFEEYGWDWSYHAFREWQGWNVECDGLPSQPIWKETLRKEVLLNGFRKNRAR